MKKRILPSRDHPGGCVLRLSQPERALLERLPREIDDVLGALESASDRPLADDHELEPAPDLGLAGFPAIEGVPAVPPSLRRLFPPAYTRDDEAERKYVGATRSELLEHHRQALQTLSETATAKVLDAEQVQQWMTALNDIRLVLGTVLEVREDGEPPAGPLPQQLLYYYYLSGLQVELVDFLAGWLPDPTPGADDLTTEDPWGEPLGGLRWDGTPQPEEG
ncbi:MAG: DUF2017 family protein [Acidimicrobiales bacterium]